MDEQSTNKEDQIRRQINPNIRRPEVQQYSVQDFVQGIVSGDLAMLSKAITLVESTRLDHQEIAQQVLEQCIKQHPASSIRLGITGTPGVGKSTFIDQFGVHLLEQNRKLAILTIDPSSQISGGSILGDKTRMEQLTKQEGVYIRPSPAGVSLGGVAEKTRESILLCECAGFDTIIIETVGVGQSETAVRALVDFFLLLLQPGAGDELQGIKRGIVEMADLLAINKADGPALEQAKRTRQAYKNAIHLLAPKTNNWPVRVVCCSALEGTGLPEIWQMILDFRTFAQNQHAWEKNRQEQARHWLHQSLNENLKQLFFQDPAVQQKLSQMEKAVSAGKISPFRAAKELIRLFIEPKA